MQASSEAAAAAAAAAPEAHFEAASLHLPSPQTQHSIRLPSPSILRAIQNESDAPNSAIPEYCPSALSASVPLVNQSLIPIQCSTAAGSLPPNELESLDKKSVSSDSSGDSDSSDRYKDMAFTYSTMVCASIFNVNGIYSH